MLAEITLLGSLMGPPDCSLSVGLREDTFGLEASMLYVDNTVGSSMVATIGHSLGPHRLSLGMGRIWWEDHAVYECSSTRQYRLDIRYCYKNIVMQYVHCSTGRELFGEQGRTPNDSYDGAYLGYQWKF